MLPRLCHNLDKFLRCRFGRRTFEKRAISPRQQYLVFTNLISISSRAFPETALKLFSSRACRPIATKLFDEDIFPAYALLLHTPHLLHLTTWRKEEKVQTLAKQYGRAAKNPGGGPEVPSISTEISSPIKRPFYSAFTNPKKRELSNEKRYHEDSCLCMGMIWVKHGNIASCDMPAGFGTATFYCIRAGFQR